jgi:hypothetical protein
LFILAFGKSSVSSALNPLFLAIIKVWCAKVCYSKYQLQF